MQIKDWNPDDFGVNLRARSAILTQVWWSLQHSQMLVHRLKSWKEGMIDIKS